MFGLMASAMGTGIFNLPFRASQTGLLIFIFYVAAAAVFSYTGCQLIKDLMEKKGYNSYSQMSEAAYGKILRRFSEICLIIYPWGITVCFQVILAKFAVQLMADAGGWNLYEDRSA